MCTVQVLLFADVIKRRTDAVEYDVNNNDGPPRGGICRKLFVDDLQGPRPAALLRTLEADLERQVRERWNFDFRTEKPLPGRYQWVGVRPGVAEVPQDSKASVEKRPQKSDSKASVEKRPQKSTKRNSQSSSTQSKITDFLQQRKRHRTDCDAVFSPKHKSRRQMDVSATSH